MTTPQAVRWIVKPTTSDVLIAGVPWPRYKLIAVIAGLGAMLLVGVLTTRAAPSVLAGAGVGVVVGLALKVAYQRLD
jgi:hypothetical protein